MNSAESAPSIDPMQVLVDTHARLERLIKKLEHENDPDSFQTIARLSEGLIKLSAESRQLAKQKRRDLAKYTPDELIEHIKTLDRRKLEFIVDSLRGDDGEGDADDDDAPIGAGA